MERRDMYRNGGQKIVNTDPILLGGESLPSAVSVGGKNPPANWMEAVNRLKYESKKQIRPTKKLPTVTDVVDYKK